MVSIITTVYNEGTSIIPFLESLRRQSRPADEILIVDAASTDDTAHQIRAFQAAHPEAQIQLHIQPGNRSIGRNTAIRHAKSELIAATDAGCIVRTNWLEEILRPFENQEVDFVGGWYQPRATTAWQKSLEIVLDFTASRVQENSFLPSTRSMAFRKSLWEAVGGFDETNSDSEDTPFSIAMRKKSTRFAFTPNAIVEWQLVESYSSLYKTIRRYARGDGKSHIWNTQYLLVMSGSIISFTLLLVSLYIPIVFVATLFLWILYLYLPCMVRRQIPRGRQWYRIPAQRATLIAANLIGFIDGLLLSVMSRKK
jgi:cellulose synthase/poly-beta-1,6-N-acetylglucosamine synthase-like glycosyltransferase